MDSTMTSGVWVRVGIGTVGTKADRKLDLGVGEAMWTLMDQGGKRS